MMTAEQQWQEYISQTLAHVANASESTQYREMRRSFLSGLFSGLVELLGCGIPYTLAVYQLQMQCANSLMDLIEKDPTATTNDKHMMAQAVRALEKCKPFSECNDRIESLRGAVQYGIENGKKSLIVELDSLRVLLGIPA
jgi:hypothetical protein